jgi:pimeloyl-ACP methyl ester carboxylesterase
MTPLTNGGQLELSDGRLLGFLELGDLCGRPVFYFHGFPGSRLEAEFANRAAKDLGLRIIACDRPGYGLSGCKAGRTLRDWPIDVTELADALGIHVFSVLGASGGGPYAAACALEIAHRLRAIGIVCGLGPIDAPHAMDGMTPINRLSLRLVGLAPWIAKPSFVLTALLFRDYTGLVMKHIVAKAGAPDKHILKRDDLKRILADSFKEAFRGGLSGPFRDLVLYGSPWRLTLQDIEHEVHLWYGGRDVIVPPSMGRYLSRTIPNSRYTFYPNEGHFSLIINHMQEIMEIFATNHA